MEPKQKDMNYRFEVDKFAKIKSKQGILHGDFTPNQNLVRSIKDNLTSSTPTNGSFTFGRNGPNPAPEQNDALNFIPTKTIILKQVPSEATQQQIADLLGVFGRLEKINIDARNGWARAMFEVTSNEELSLLINA